MTYIIYLYATLLLSGAIGIIANRRGRSNVNRSYSIVVVARNEEEVLPYLLDSLANINYQQELYEIILVDDGSTDRTYRYMKKPAQENENVKVIKITAKKLPGKKAGLQAALEAASKDILLFTDADCIVHPNWLINTNLIWDNNTSMVVGYAPETLDSRQLSFLSKCFRRFIGLAAAGIYAATIGLGVPFSCAGRNLAVKRESLLTVGGYKSLDKESSGDDKQMLNLIRSQGGKIKYCFAKSVATLPEIKAFNEQQKRRFGKLKMSSPLHLSATILIILFYLSLPFYLIFTANPHGFSALSLATGTVWITNLIRHKEPFHLLDVIFLMVYPYYFIYYTLSGLNGNWKWK